MKVSEAVYQRRSRRSFTQKAIPNGVLAELVDGARVGPSAGNRQPLEYIVVNEPGLCAQLFGCLKWSLYTAPKGTPAPGHEPTAYVVVLRRGDTVLGDTALYDVGAAVQTMCLMAEGKGLGSCWIKTVNFPKIREIFAVPEGIEIDCVVALGYPAEEPKRVDLRPDQTGLEVIRYWRDENNQQFVPKRALASILFYQKYGERKS